MDLAALSPQKVTPPTQTGDKSCHYVVFRIDRQHYALPLEHVTRVVRMVAFTPVPDMPYSVLGIINMAGQVLPVIDLRRLFGQTGKDPELQDVLLIIRVRGQTGAIVADEVLNVLEFTSTQLRSPSAAVAQSRFLAAAVQHDDTMILVLDATRLLPNPDKEGSNGFTGQ
jgi:purine-binding chemotaxis protein CheW